MLNVWIGFSSRIWKSEFSSGIFKFKKEKKKEKVKKTYFSTHLSFSLLVAGLEASDEDDDGDDDGGHDRSRGRNDDVVQLLAAANTLCSDLTTLVVRNVVRIDGNVF